MSTYLSRPDPTESKSVPPNEVGDGCLHSSITVLTIAWCRTLHKHKGSQLPRSHNGTVPKLNQWRMNRDPYPLQFVLNQHANRGPRLPQVVWTSLWTPLYWKHVLFLHSTLSVVAFRAAYLEAMLLLCFLSYT